MTLHLRTTVSSGDPIYRQIAAQLCAAAASGMLRPGDALPAPGALAQDLVVHPRAVERAYALLADRGVFRRDERGRVRVTGDGAEAAAAPPPSGRRPDPAPSPRSQDLAWQLSEAREVQQRLLPASMAVAGLDVAAVSRPALGVGGDYHDVVPGPDDDATLVIADVSGKGLPAALLMAALRGSLHAHLEQALPLEALVGHLNRRLYDGSAPNRFATFFCGRWRAGARTLEYVNAGHQPPLCCAGGAIRALDVTGPALGLVPDATYGVRALRLDRGDLLLLYSDGVTDALDAVGDTWGESRLHETLQAAGRLPAGQVVQQVLAAADRHADGTPQFDDITIVAVRVPAAGAGAVA
ncbi:MAG: PP2C family protein-serine/threonine phosphatase [Vicinamibacterales bacterium]